MQKQARLRPCPDCGAEVSRRASKCIRCGGPLWHKTAKEAYFSWGGMGLFDLIPGIRDLPGPVRLILMLIVVGVLVLIVIPAVRR